MSLFLVLLVLFFWKVFGIEKDKHRYIKDIILEIIIFLTIYFILYYLLGLIIGFARVDNYLTLYGINTFILPLFFSTILKEFFRYEMLCKSEGSKMITCITVLLFIFLDITMAIRFSSFADNYNIFRFIALYLLPAISKSVVFSYIALKVGYKPLIVYSLVMELYAYILPIVPNLSEYLVSIVSLLLPIILWYLIYLFFKKEQDEHVERNYKKRSFKPLIGTAIIVAIIVYFTSGEFKYWTLAIASGSMSPSIHKGDVVIVEKIEGNYGDLQLGQVIAYRKDGIIIVHRLVNIVKYADKYYFYTKGDANNSMDNFIIEEDMIIGVVNHKIPYIGIPTVWLNEL